MIAIIANRIGVRSFLKSQRKSVVVIEPQITGSSRSGKEINIIQMNSNF